jgi:hypothetical protein
VFDWSTYVLGAVTVILGAVVVNIVADFLTNSTKKVLQPVWKRVAEKPCPTCESKGTVRCPACGETGKVSKIVSKSGPCPTCKGSRFTQVPCPRCGGLGTLARQLRGSATPISRTWWGLLPLPVGWRQRVDVTVTNDDERAGMFEVNLRRGSPLGVPESKGQRIPAGEARTFSFIFRVPDRTGIPSTFGLVPESVALVCGECQGTKARDTECKTCGATGIVNESLSVDARCDNCAGNGRKQCVECTGTGRVARF